MTNAWIRVADVGYLGMAPETVIASLYGEVVGSENAREADPDLVQAEVLSIFDEQSQRLLRYSMSFGLTLHDAEDVVQEVFLALFRHLSANRSRENLVGWIFRTTHNLSLKRRRTLQIELRRTGSTEAGVEFRSEVSGPEEILLFNERQQRLHAVVQALPDKDQRCLQLRAEGLRYREIATTAGVSLGSVCSSLTRSFQKLLTADER